MGEGKTGITNGTSEHFRQRKEGVMGLTSSLRRPSDFSFIE